jgi:hypothetical protein
MPSRTRAIQPPPTDFCPQPSLRRRGPHIEPLVCQRTRQVGAQPEWRAWNPCHGEPNGWRKHSRDPKGLGTEVPRSDVPLIRPFQASVDTVKNTIVELCNITTQYTIGNEVAQLHTAPSSSAEASLDIIIRMSRRAARRGASSTVRGPHTRSATMAATTSKQTAPTWCAPWPPQVVASIKHDHPWITLRISWRRLAQTTPTPSSTSSGTVA